MNIKKKVVENITKELEAQQRKLKMKCESNSYQMKKLADENTVSKREIAKLGELIKSLSLKPKNMI